MRKCEYKNCEVEVTGRANKKYCCRLHKQSQRKIRVRAKKKLLKQATRANFIDLIYP